MSARCHPQFLLDINPIQYGNELAYHDTHEMKTMLNPDFWLNVASTRKDSRIYPMDIIKIRQVTNVYDKPGKLEVVAYAEVIVLKVTEQGPVFDLLRARDYRPEDEKSETIGSVEWNIGKKTHDVVVGGNVVKSFSKEQGGKAEAEEYLDSLFSGTDKEAA